MKGERGNDKLNKIDLYVDNVIEKGKKFNLTADLDKEIFIQKHIIDCQKLNDFVDFNEIKKAVDIGTGAGLPGFVLALSNPNTDFTLVDSLNKRINFLSELAYTLSVENVTLECMRAEEFTRLFNYREYFDAGFSRALAPLNVLLEYITPAIRVGGHFYAYKSKKYKEELLDAENAIEILNVKLVNEFTYTLNNGEFRVILDFEKIDNTPDKYPRRVGKPSKKPL